MITKWYGWDNYDWKINPDGTRLLCADMFLFKRFYLHFHMGYSEQTGREIPRFRVRYCEWVKRNGEIFNIPIRNYRG